MRRLLLNFLNFSDAFSTKKYFGMFALIAIFPLVYSVLSAYCLFPSDEQVFDKIALQNESIVIFMEINLTDVQLFPSFLPPNKQVRIKIYELMLMEALINGTRVTKLVHCVCGNTIAFSAIFSKKLLLENFRCVCERKKFDAKIVFEK